MISRITFLVLSALTLAACGGSSQDAATTSGFRQLTSDGFIRSDLEDNFQRTSLRVRQADGDGYAFATGVRDEEGFAGYSTILATTRVGPSPVSGTAKFETEYQLLEITDIDLNGGLLTGENNLRTGILRLRADFAADTLRGTSDDGLLRVRGTLSDRNAVGGEVTWRGTDGPLTGRVSETETVGAFHGNDADIIFAGGFVSAD